MTIKQIFDEIASEPGKNNKMEILKKHKDNELLKRVLYLANSPRIKFHIKQIPEYTTSILTQDLSKSLDALSLLRDRVLTGHDGVKHLSSILSISRPDDAYIIERIIEKDCKIGMDTSINKVFPKLIEDTYYMGAIPFNDKKVRAIFEGGKQGISEVKADGRFCNITIENNVPHLTSRQGELTLITGGVLLKDLSKFEDCVLNGELVIPGIKREISNGIITSVIDISEKLASEDPADNKKAQASIDKMIKRHNITYAEVLERIKFVVWDILDIQDYVSNVSTVKRIDRLNRLSDVINNKSLTMISLVEHKFVSSYEEALAHFSEMLERGEEGTILKSMDGVWKDGKHSYQIKMKVEFDLDLKVVGFEYGNKGTKNEFVISSVNCESSCGRLKATAQGIKKEVMDYITANQSNILETIAVVKCNGLTSNRNGGNSVNYPSLKSFRNDKTIANSFEECVDIDAAAKGIKKALKTL